MATRKKHVVVGVISAVSLALLVFGYSRWARAQYLEELSSECPSAAAANDWRRLQRVSQQWLSEEPESSHPRFWLGEALQNQGDYQQAMKYLQAIRLDEPRGIDAAIRVMHIQLFVRNRPSEALQSAARLLEQDPALPEPIRVRIYFYAMTFQRDKLLKEIDDAIRYRADLPEHFVHLMLLEDLSFRDGSTVVGKWLDQDLELKELLSDSMFVHNILNERNAAILEAAAPNQTELNVIRQKCVEMARQRSQSGAILELAIRLELESGNIPLVGDLLDLVPESAVNDPVFWLHRGKFAMDGQNTVDAKQSFEKAMELHPLAWRARGYLATVKRLEGDTKEAGKLQEVAAEGSTIVDSCIQLKSSREVPRSLLRQISGYAEKCHALKIVNAIDRREM